MTQSPHPTSGPSSRSTSAAAVASLVFGVLGCIPFIPGFLAVVCASFGLKATRNRQVGGRGWAIAGLVMGLASMGGWSLMGGVASLNYLKSKPARPIATQFVTDLSDGNLAAASELGPTIPLAELRDDSNSFKALGALVSVNYVVQLQPAFGADGQNLRARAIFANGAKFCNITYAVNGSSITITSLKFQ
jgi:hypothetical protein